MTAGFFSPMPPARTGVADYSAALIAQLRRFGTVRLNDSGADVRLYHLGNNRLHRSIYELALDRPGVIVLHDAVLQHFFLGSWSEDAYAAEFVYNYGEWNSGLAHRMWRNRAQSGTDPLYFRYPMLRRVVERSRAVIVHNPAAARRVREHAPSARVYEIPHLRLPGAEPAAHDVLRLRARLEAAPSDFVFGLFGHLRESKRVSAIGAAFAALRNTGHRALLLIAGEFVSQDLERNSGPLLAMPGVRRAAYAPENRFRMYAQAVDACINLRYPAAGETSGIAIRLMGAGKPVLLTAGEESAGIPETAAIRIDSGPAESDMLRDYMSWLCRFPADARAVGDRARRHIEERHNPARVASLYWRALEESRA